MDSLKTVDEKCPYNCMNGFIFVKALKRKVACPHCSKMRQDYALSNMQLEANNEDIESKLGLRKRIVGKTDYNFDSLFRGGMTLLDTESLSDVKSVLDKLVGDISLGEVPKYSMLFNLGAKVFEENFVNPLLIRGYLAGLVVSPVLSVEIISDVRRHSESEEFYDEEEAKRYDGYIHSDLCVVVIDEGVSKNGVSIIKGFVACRGRVGKPTILLTHSNINEILYDFATNKDYFDYTYPKLISVKYKSKDSLVTRSQDSTKSMNTPTSETEETTQSCPQLSFSDLMGTQNML